MESDGVKKIYVKNIKGIREVDIYPAPGVNEIAGALNFGSPYYFMKLFKKRVEMSPTQWRSYSRGGELAAGRPRVEWRAARSRSLWAPPAVGVGAVGRSAVSPGCPRR